MAYYLMALAITPKVLSLVFFVFAHWLYKAPPSSTEDDTKGNINSAYAVSTDSNLNEIDRKEQMDNEQNGGVIESSHM